MNRDKLLLKIAKDRVPSVQSFEVHNSDQMDFHTISIQGIKDMLEAAFKAGQQTPEAGRGPVMYVADVPQLQELLNEEVLTGEYLELRYRNKKAILQFGSFKNNELPVWSTGDE